ncbi:Alpha/Beta hydrolase protein [Dactylonectria macrodidyma]|uniref:Alpha/Beta hydrolase protein n=1 Tax=Dactylonectria macrodidyma TaxID=307937 RepID=A0A9P9E551_9HYPO|nr:Alpha/Beta hydrolase protein [Dactylonectria macrodidyma]
MRASKHILTLGTAFVVVANASHAKPYPPDIKLSNETTAMYRLSNDSEFAFILNEYASLANEGGAATGEVLRAAAEIEPGNFESWYHEFNFLANKIHAMAVKAEARNALVSAREAYFRSSSYYRGADFFLHGNISDPRIDILWKNQLRDFNKAVALLHRPAKQIELQANGFKVPAYFYPADPSLPRQKPASGKRLPTVIVGTGYDGSQQALYHSNCRGIVERGWNCITYEGPGQPTVRRQQNLGFIPEWWEVVTPVVDYLHTRDDVDVDRIALIGLSFGGTLAPLVATHEHRLAAVLAVDGMLSIQAAFKKEFPTAMIELYTSGNETGFNGYVEAVLSMPDIPTNFRWVIEQGMYAWNTTNPYKWFDETGKFFLDAAKLAKIKCPVFVASGEDDHLTPGQPEEMARLLGDKATYFLFKTDVGAGEHCALGAEQQLAMETGLVGRDI